MSSANSKTPFASNAAILGSLAFIGIGISLVLLQAKKKPSNIESNSSIEFSSEGGNARRVHILYGTTTSTAKNFANTLSRHIAKRCSLDVNVTNLKDYNDESLPKEDILLIISSTWEGGKAPPSCQVFFDTVEDSACDFRVSKDHLSNVEFAVFGLGGEIYGPNYCKAVKELDDQLGRLGGQRMLPVAVGDDSSNLEQTFYKWNSKLVKMLEQRFPLSAEAKKSAAANKTEKKPVAGSSQKKDSKSSSCCSTNTTQPESNKDSSCCGGAKKSEDEVNNEGCCSAPNDEDNFDDELEEEDRINNAYVNMEDEEQVVDLEEIGPAVNRMKLENTKKQAEVDERREMVTKLQRKALTKEGYKIIGSHSAVKLCRWTKNQLRGRGGCYKHSFYGITSYQCMEATPSLACANKCVFCWRHHKNPVGTEWRWKEDDPSTIVQEAIRLHVSMINEMKGVPGVQTSRLQEAYTVKHCALSLVGEPIMYPRINDMMKELHDREISTFLVTNAQFPERIEHLDPVTQLYVSVDAATKDSLKAIDRPLFKDFWERFIGSLSALRDKKQRTVYRMTLVKSWNMTEVDDYVQLIEAGLPDFIEIKSMTYCGKSDASSLTMENVPWHKEVCTYGEEICRRLKARNLCSVTYNIATEHEHSCCILLAREDKFKVNDEWYTWIDYPKFHALVREYYASGKTKSFTSEDYRAKTPSWAVYQSAERGFDPIEQRWRRNKVTGAQEEIPYQSTDSGCG